MWISEQTGEWIERFDLIKYLFGVHYDSFQAGEAKNYGP